VSVCKQGCGLPVDWRKNDKGAWKCYNAGTMTDHWDACSQERTRLVQKHGKPFKDKQGEGYIYEGKKKYFHMVAETKFGVPVKAK
jgi:hypothetical protein